MIMKQKAIYLIAMTTLFSASCSEEGELRKGVSDSEIIFITSTRQLETRAKIFEEDSDLTDSKKDGGNFLVSAYTSGTEELYLSSQRVTYSSQGKWEIVDNNGNPESYFWPNNNLDFFSFMPIVFDSENGIYKPMNDTYVTLGSYTSKNGQTFSCSLPAEVNTDTDTHEFIYAFITNQGKSFGTGNNGQPDPVNLIFHHPFAIINFKIDEHSYRMNVKSIQLKGLYLDGIYSTGTNAPTGNEKGTWIQNGTDSRGKTALIMNVNKRFPTDINSESALFNGIVVMPQSLEDAELTLNYNIENTEGTDHDFTATVKLKDVISGNLKWEQGTKYAYLIKIGSNNEIHVNVTIEGEEWIENGDTDIDVE